MVTGVVRTFIEKVSHKTELKYRTHKVQYFSGRTLISKIEALAPMFIIAMIEIVLANYEVKFFMGKWRQ